MHTYTYLYITDSSKRFVVKRTRPISAPPQIQQSPTTHFPLAPTRPGCLPVIPPVVPEVPVTTETPMVTDDIGFVTESPITGIPVVGIHSPVPGIDVYPEEIIAMGEIFGIIAGVALTVVALMYVGK